MKIKELILQGMEIVNELAELKTLKHSNIVLISSLNSKMVEKKYQMTPAKTVEEGLEIGFNQVGRNGRIWVFPSGSTILPCLS